MSLLAFIRLGVVLCFLVTLRNEWSDCLRSLKQLQWSSAGQQGIGRRQDNSEGSSTGIHIANVSSGIDTPELPNATTDESNRSTSANDVHNTAIAVPDELLRRGDVVGDLSDSLYEWYM